MMPTGHGLQDAALRMLPTGRCPQDTAGLIVLYGMSSPDEGRDGEDREGLGERQQSACFLEICRERITQAAPQLCLPCERFTAELKHGHFTEVIPVGHINLAFSQDEKPQDKDPDEDKAPKDSKSKGKKKKKKKSKKEKEPVKTVGLFQLFRYATCPEVLLMLIALVCAAIHGAALPLMCVVFGKMTDSFVQSGQQFNFTGNFSAIPYNFTTNSTDSCVTIPGVDIEENMTLYAYYFVGIGAGVLLLGTFQVMLFLLTATRQTKRIREKYFHAVLHQQMAWFDTHPIGELNTRLTDDINTINDGLGDKICIFVQFFCRFLAGIIIGFIFGWKLTLVIMSVSPLLAGSAAVWSKILATLTSKELSAYAKAGAVAEEILVAIRTVVAFNGQKKAVEKYEANLVEAKNFGVKKAITTNVSMGITQFFIFATYALAFWYGTKLSVDEPENYSIGKVITVFFSVMIGAFSLGQGAPNLESVAKARGAAYAIYNTIDMPRPIDSSSKDGFKPDIVKGDIEFKNIHFSYPSRKDVKILQGMSLKVPRGKTIALVGASGCGKSTTIQLLQRFYDPDAGEVTLDGRDIRTLNVRWLRENMGIVSQEPVLFGTTIAENIRYGREDATDEDIDRAVREANAYEFISKLPDKLNTMVGERGAQLSGGQKQRIAIARALVKNPKILLLDEATSALDTQSESIVQAALDKVLDHTQVGHIKTLNDPSKTLNDPSKTLNDPSKTLNDPSKTLNDPSKTLNDPSKTLNDPSKTLNDPSKTLNDPSKTLNDPSKTLNDPSKTLNDPSKTLNDPSKTLNDPSKTLNDPSKTLNDPSKTLNDPSKMLNDPSKMLNDPSKTLNDPSKMLNDPSKMLNDPSKMLNDPSKMLNDPIHSGVIRCATPTTWLHLAPLSFQTADQMISCLVGMENCSHTGSIGIRLDTPSFSKAQPLKHARAGRTTIVIAHRLSTIRTADVIAGFRDGQVVEQGTHRELMNKKGVYYSLVMQQTSGNLEDEDDEDDEDDDDVSEGETSQESSDSDSPDDLMEVKIENGGFGRSSIRRSLNLQRKSSKRKSTKKKKSKEPKKPKKSKAEKKKKKEEKGPEVPFSKILALNKPEWPYVMVGTVASFVGGAVYPCVGILFAKIIGVFAEPDAEIKRQKTLMFSLLFLLVGAVAFITYFFQGYMFGKSGEILTMRLRSQAFKAILRQDIAWFDDHNNAVGVLTTKLATDASLVKGAAGSRLGLVTSSVCALLIAVVVAFCFSWQLTLLILACVPFLSGANFIQMRAMTGHASKDQSALEASGKISTETVENFKTVVGLTREDVFFRKFNDSLSTPYKSALCKAPIYGITFALAQAIPYFVNAAVFRFGAWLIAHCYTEYENVFLVFSIIVFAAMSIGQSSSFAPDFAKAKVAAGRILNLLEKTPEIDIYDEGGEKPMNFIGDIEFRDVHFSYPTRPNIKILQGLNVSVAQGQTLALVGSSGCGKSTSIQLLERFYNPANGHVFADKTDTQRLNLAWLRSQLGLVSQEPILFDCTIAENIQYGDNSRVVSQEEIVEAARNANIHDFILSLPEKYNTRVGDKGTQLSGGQKQRIAIARALVRRPKVLLLDEATSALDTESEKIVQKALDDARQGRTCIVIAHRLTTIQNADIIAVIQNGQVAEQGTHSELMAKQGAYYALVNAQVAH
ncbi:hypothetical protein NFI96_023271 [Prochilodus magdalenae]|nr:hypothetical protein NFI96_023271 [Prochilodus magdalenae]